MAQQADLLAERAGAGVDESGRASESGSRSGRKGSGSRADGGYVGVCVQYY